MDWPSINDWVLVRPQHFRSWSKAFPALVTSRTLHADAHRCDTVSLLIPNQLVLQHGFVGHAFEERAHVDLKDIRRYNGNDLPTLKKKMLAALQQASRQQKDVEGFAETVGCGQAPAQLARTESIIQQTTPCNPALQPTLLDILSVVPEMGCIMAECLWNDVETRVGRNCRFVQVSPKDVLGQRTWSKFSKMKQDIFEARAVRKCWLVERPEILDLVWCAQSIGRSIVRSVKLTLHNAHESKASLRMISIMSSACAKHLPSLWSAERTLRVRPTLDAVDQETIAAVEAARRMRHKARRIREATEHAKEWRLSEQAHPNEWQVNEELNGTKQKQHVVAMITSVFATSYTLDPSICALTMDELVKHSNSNVSEEEIREVLCFLSRTCRVFVSGDLIFPL